MGGATPLWGAGVPVVSPRTGPSQRAAEPADLRRIFEIHGHEELAVSTGVTVYVCHPHSPWQRGSNENTNGLLRQWFPRSTDFYNLD
jgi:hypothetical protein